MIVTSSSYDTELAKQQIFPKYKLLSFNLDVADGGDTWSEIIAGTYGQTPTDLTSYVTSIDFTQDRLAVKMVDDGALVFHPDAGALRKKIRAGRCIRLYEGFETLAQTEWLVTFTGTIEGSYSWTYERAKPIEVGFSVFNRANNQAWKRRNVTSRNFTVGSDWGSMFQNIVQDIMFLEDNELAAPTAWNVLFDKNTNQVANYPPWDAIEQLMWGASKRPFFNGQGQLDWYGIDQERVDLVLTDDAYLVKYDSRDGGLETINKVVLTYISNTLSRVEGPDQVLGTASVTAGFFVPDVNIDVYYSDERKVRSDNPRMLIVQSVNSGIIDVGDETFLKVDEFHSNVHVQIESFIISLATAMLALYLFLAAVPDLVAALGGGVTIPFGRILQAAAMVTILLIMMSIGVGQYEIWGTPYEMVYLEQQYIAIKAGVEFWQEREKEIRNDFISTVDQAKPLTLTQLHYEVMKEQPRSLVLRYDPRIEEGDIIQLSNSVRVYVGSVKRVLRRGSGDPLLMNIEGWRTVL